MTDKKNTTFAKRIKALRLRAGKTQQEMADIIGVSTYNTWGEYERGHSVPRFEKTKLIADYFGVSVDYLMGNTDELVQEPPSPSIVDAWSEITDLIKTLTNSQNVQWHGQLLDYKEKQILIFMLKTTRASYGNAVSVPELETDEEKALDITEEEYNEMKEIDREEEEKKERMMMEALKEKERKKNNGDC